MGGKQKDLSSVLTPQKGACIFVNINKRNFSTKKNTLSWRKNVMRGLVVAYSHFCRIEFIANEHKQWFLLICIEAKEMRRLQI